MRSGLPGGRSIELETSSSQIVSDLMDIAVAIENDHRAVAEHHHVCYPVHQIADWAGTSERMIIDVYRHKLSDVTDLGPAI